MSKIWHVIASFEDWDSNWFVTIGHFSDKSNAEKTRDKWDGIFDEILKLLEEPEDWNPRLDEYYDHPYYVEGDSECGLPGTYSLYWTESKQYVDLLDKYEFVTFLKGIQIEELVLDEDILIKGPDFTGEKRKDLKLKLIELERDWKLKRLTE